MDIETVETEIEIRQWDEMLPDVLGLIFQKLSVKEILTIAPCVCKPWGRVVSGPYCWQEIDIQEVTKNIHPEKRSRLLEMLISRSGSCLNKLSVCGYANEPSLSSIVHNAESLQVLKLSRSNICDSVLQEAAGMLSNLTYLDISDCVNITAAGLEAIGSNCKSLNHFRRSMHPTDAGKISAEDEVNIIVSTMPNLKHLEIQYWDVNTEHVLKILHGCSALESLDIRGCWNVKLSDEQLKQYPRLEVTGPIVKECYYVEPVWDVSSNSSGDSGYSSLHFDTADLGEYGPYDDEFELRYEGDPDIIWEEFQDLPADGFGTIYEALFGVPEPHP